MPVLMTMPDISAETLLGATGWAFRKPDVKGTRPAFTPKAEKEKQKNRTLLKRRHTRSQQVEAGEIQTAAGGCENQERDQQQTGARVRHDQKKHPGLARFFFFVLEDDQEERRQRHHFPRHQEEEGIRRGEDQRQTRQQQVEEEPEGAQVAASLHLPQVSKGVQRNGGRQHRQRHVEIGRQRVQADRPCERRVAEGQADRGGAAAEEDGRRSRQIEKRTRQRCRAAHPARNGRLPPQRQTGHGARKPDDDSAQEQLSNHRADASRSTSSSI
jgi:hypothetical protein